MTPVLAMMKNLKPMRSVVISSYNEHTVTLNQFRGDHHRPTVLEVRNCRVLDGGSAVLGLYKWNLRSVVNNDGA